jgi:hypothetical protein
MKTPQPATFEAAGWLTSSNPEMFTRNPGAA